MATFLRHEGCKRCGSSDARAIYADGSEYCFSCGSTGRGQFIPSVVYTETESAEHILLPQGFEPVFPKHVEDFLKPTSITLTELYENNYVFSERYFGQTRRVLARVFAELRNHTREQPLPQLAYRGSGSEAVRLHAYEAKFLGSAPKEDGMGLQHVHALQGGAKARGSKTKFTGPKAEISGASSPLCGVQQACVLVEDSLSAIKVGRHCASYTLFGSTIDNVKLSWLVKPYKKIYIWLDSDKFNYAKLLSERVQMMGKESVVVFTQQDPKYVEDSDIVKLLSG